MGTEGSPPTGGRLAIRREQDRRLAIAFSNAPVRVRMDALLGAPNARSLVRRLPIQDVYYLIKEIGLPDAVDLLALAGPEQFRGFLDLDGWDRDRVDVAHASEWIQALASGHPDDLAEILDGLDYELLAFLLTRMVLVHDLTDERDAAAAPEGEKVLMTTPDSHYAVEILDESLADTARTLLNAVLVRRGPLGLSIFLAGLRAELPSELEETAYRWRTARMADLGFPDYYEALEIYQGLPAARSRPAAIEDLEAGASHAYFLQRTYWEGLLGEAMARIEDARLRQRIADDLVFLVNTALVADRVDPGEPEEVMATLRRVRAYLEIGLSSLAGGDVERAATVLADTSLRHLFRVAAGLTADLGRRARRLRRAAGERLDGLDLDDRLLLDSLLLQPPRKADGSDFSSLAEISEARDALERIRVVLGVPEDRG